MQDTEYLQVWNIGHRGEQRVVKNSGASERTLLAVSVEEAGASSLEEMYVFHFYPNVFVSEDCIFDR